MKKKIRQFLILLASLLALGVLTTTAYAQSFLIINNSGCIQWIQVKNSNGNYCVRKALDNYADVTLPLASGTGISLIQGGPTAALDHCCYSNRINASVSLDGVKWRIEIEPSGLRVINRNTNAEVFSASGKFSKCVTPSSGVMGSIGQTPQPLSTRQ